MKNSHAVNNNNNNHYFALPAWISPILSRYPSLSSIAPGRSSSLYPVSAQMYILVLAGLRAFARPCKGVHRGISLMSSSLILLLCPACLVRLTLIVFVMGVRWPHNCCFVGCCLQNLFNIARSILVELPSSFFSIGFVSVHVVHPYSSIDTTAVWKKLCFILSVSSDFHMIDNLSIAIHAFASHVLMSFSVDETLLPGLVNLSTSFKGPPFSAKMLPL